MEVPNAPALLLSLMPFISVVTPTSRSNRSVGDLAPYEYMGASRQLEPNLTKGHLPTPSGFGACLTQHGRDTAPLPITRSPDVCTLKGPGRDIHRHKDRNSAVPSLVLGVLSPSTGATSAGKPSRPRSCSTAPARSGRSSSLLISTSGVFYLRHGTDKPSLRVVWR